MNCPKNTGKALIERLSITFLFLVFGGCFLFLKAPKTNAENPGTFDCNWVCTTTEHGEICGCLPHYKPSLCGYGCTGETCFYEYPPPDLNWCPDSDFCLSNLTAGDCLEAQNNLCVPCSGTEPPAPSPPTPSPTLPPGSCGYNTDCPGNLNCNYCEKCDGAGAVGCEWLSGIGCVPDLGFKDCCADFYGSPFEIEESCQGLDENSCENAWFTCEQTSCGHENQPCCEGTCEEGLLPLPPKEPGLCRCFREEKLVSPDHCPECGTCEALRTKEFTAFCPDPINDPDSCVCPPYENKKYANLDYYCVGENYVWCCVGYDDCYLSGRSQGSCWQSTSPRRVSWPQSANLLGLLKYCRDCNETQRMTNYCSQSFEAQTQLEINLPANQCDEYCEADDLWYAYIPWQGKIAVDLKSLKVPFAGKTTELTKTGSREDHNYEDEILYLADYFEGTHEYYRDYDTRPDGTNNTMGPFDTFATRLSLIPSYTGVLRKLAPYEYQNQIKKEYMVNRQFLSENAMIEYEQIRDYRVYYPRRLCWNAPLWHHVIHILADHYNLTPDGSWEFLDYCLYGIRPIEPESWLANESLMYTLWGLFSLYNLMPFTPDINFSHQYAEGDLLHAFHRASKEEEFEDINPGPPNRIEWTMPPSPDEENYAQKWAEWKERKKLVWEGHSGYWWKLWQALPLVTREATQAYVNIVPETRYLWLDQYGDGEFWYGESAIETQLPHLARLWETSRWVQQILMPESENLDLVSDEPFYALSDASGSTLHADSNSIVTENTNQYLPDASISLTSCGSNKQVLGEKTLLAQDEGESYVPVVAASGSCFYQGSNNYYFTLNASYTFPWLQEGCGYGDIYTEIAPGVGLFCKAHFACENQIANWTITGSPGQSLPLNLFIHASRTGPGGPPCHTNPQEWNIGLNINIHEDGTCSVSGGGIAPLPSPTPLPCGFLPRSYECDEESIADHNLNDSACEDPLNPVLDGVLHAVEEVENETCRICSDLDCGKDCGGDNPHPHCGDCCRTYKKTITVSRQVEIHTSLPYLEEIWNHTGDPYQGFFNIFRPAGSSDEFKEIEPFEPFPAESYINYYFTDCNSPDNNVSVVPGTCQASLSPGEFYFPFLGGIQKAKEWISTKVLVPYLD